MHRFERLHAWRKCHELVLAIYRISETWPPIERYGLTSQVRRAAVSAAANIVEGSARLGARELSRFLVVSFGSLTELAYLLRVAKDLGYLSEADLATIEPLREEASKLTWGLYRSVRASATLPSGETA